MRHKDCVWPSTSLTVLVLTRDRPFPLLGLPLAVQALFDLFGSVWAQQLSQWSWLLCAILASLAEICSHPLLSVYMLTYHIDLATFRACE